MVRKTPAASASLPAAMSSSSKDGTRLTSLWTDDGVRAHANQDAMECPLCLEEIDISDANFKPCPCGYQICRFCWHHIKQNLNGRCPACRRKYSDQAIEFKAMSTEEYVIADQNFAPHAGKEEQGAREEGDGG